MPAITVLRTEALSLFFESPQVVSDDGSFPVSGLSVRLASSLFSALPSKAATLRVQAGSVTPWAFGATPTVFRFGPAEAALNFEGKQAASAGWRSLEVEVRDNRMQLAFSGLRIASDFLPGVPLEGDATLIFEAGKFVDSASTVTLQKPIASSAQLLTAGLSKVVLKWVASGTPGISLPGVQVTPPDSGSFTLSLDSSGAAPKVTLDLNAAAGQALSATSGFAWLRDVAREIHPPSDSAAVASLFAFSATALREAKLQLIAFEIGKPLLPKFLQAAGSDFQTTFRVTPNGFRFPFLSKPAQFIEIVSFNQETGDITLKFEAGGLRVEGLTAKVSFNRETFTLNVDHDAGIEIRGPHTLAAQTHLGLNWKFETAETGEDDVHWFTLVTKNSHYQLQLSPTAQIVLEYTKATKEGEPIRFVAKKFVLGETGVSLTAEVQDDPARLSGINTRFTFHGTRLEIVESRIQDFTLTGSGPLPPDLVGDATADIALQFQQKGDALALVSGAAELKGTGLLQAKTVHFDFKVDALGLKFVDDHGYHLYFTVTGSATYVPEPFTEDDDPLHFLSSAAIELVECPLTGDARVLAKHINFLIEFNEPIEFKLLGAFTFELRAIGFLCSVEAFDGDAALELSGQVMFSPEGKDTKSAKVDFHGMLIGAPAPGDLLPRIHLDTLGVEIEYGDAFHLSGEVEFRNSETEKGFLGEGVIEIKGMPTIAASFAFLRVRLDESSNWVSAWFIFIEVRKVSLQIPVVEIYLREVGLGFGYRFTLTSIKTADTEKDIAKLIKALRELSRTAGDLSKRDRWAVDLEQVGEDPRWTIAFRAMFSQTSASTLLKYNDAAEKELPCVFLFDAVAAIRSDLTFFMAARGWINTNYNDFLEDRDLSEKPIVSGFIILSARQKRLLAHVASNPEGSLGTRPKVPEFVANALAKSEFSATLLIEPGLFHLELGWPNMLRWSQSFGPLNLEFRGGFIYRVTAKELVIGISFQARASLEIKAEINLVVVGAKLEASMRAALGARLLAVTSLQSADDVAVYAAIGIDIRIAVKITLWIGIDLGFVSLTKDFTFSFSVGFTAGLEVGLRNASLGIQGSGTVAVELMGHALHFTASFEKNGQAVRDARDRTAPFLKLGLEATEVDDVPGIPGGSQQAAPAAPPNQPAVSAQPGATRPVDPPTTPAPATAPTTSKFFSASSVPTAAADRTGRLNQPNYVIYLIHKPAADGKIYFLLMPKGEGETGFLPAPPSNAATAGNDFELTLPTNGRPVAFQRFDPFANGSTGGFVDVPQGPVSWKARWAAPIKDQPAGAPRSVTIADYLKHAYLLKRPFTEGGDNVPVSDPEALGSSVPLEDDRVHNPTDSAFEAAVRGAVEQFQGSPMFKRDPNQPYDRSLGDAFNPATTLYTKPGANATKLYDPDAEHAVQFRGTVVHDLVEDFRADVASGGTASRAGSIPFEMGLVFRMANDQIPAWVTDVVTDATQQPSIRQRGDNGFGPSKAVTAFNVKAASFTEFPPQFERVRQYTSSNTIAIAWDLLWPSPPAGCTGLQASPEHHLRNYEVRRRPLEGGEPEVFYTVKNASALNASGSALEVLKPRFKVVDHFNDESLEQQAALPASGRTYLYTITPCDVAGNLGRPLTLVATRFPDEPPAVPADAELTVNYPSLKPEDVPVTESTHPSVLEPAFVDVVWREPVRREGPFVPVGKYRLIFRRTPTLPVGSYGFDAVSSQPRKNSLPTSNARPLPTDIRVDLEKIEARPSRKHGARIELATLRTQGILPGGAARLWRPESWTVFFQTESANGVPSALAPVQIRLNFEGIVKDKGEERRPGELEFLPLPTKLPLLPPEDMNAITGVALFPMPKAGNGQFAGSLASIEFADHPQSTRGIRFRWNQAPTDKPGYEPRLHAGYSILELNIDANTEETFNNKQLLADALWTVQEVRMLPSADLLLAPANTLATSQWEAWYPSTIARRKRGERPPGSEARLGSWFSSRESYLEWPPRAENQSTFLHPHLDAIVTTLQANFIVDLQIAPPIQEMDLSGLLRSTAPGPDPYGWGILQRFGLCVALSLRNKASGEIITGADLLAKLQEKLAALPVASKYLYVELLFQPSRTVSFAASAPPAPEALLGIVQLSLRPAIVPLFRYFAVTVAGAPGANITLQIGYGSSTTILNPLDSASGEVQLPPDRTSVTRTVRVPLTGTLTLLLRSKGMSGAEPTVSTSDAGVTITGPHDQEFAPTDDRVASFTSPAEVLLAEFQKRGAAAKAEWENFKRYAESLNSNQRTAEQRISVPTDEAGMKAILPAVLSWTARLFDHSGLVGDGTDGKRTGLGPWIATAYPRSTSQVFATPDESGRLSHDYLITDRYAHNFRYYIRPFGRYDLLWRSLLQSPFLFPRKGADVMPPATPDPANGGLDVVLNRTQPVAMPLVLKSGRLDPQPKLEANAKPAPAPPGKTWEVIVARHPEQALAERNQTVFRQLAYRGVAFTVLRKFAFLNNITALMLSVGGNHDPRVASIHDISPDLPGDFPDPDHLNFTRLTPAQSRSLDLPLRLGSFQQGAMVLQWNALPFFYEHKLLLIAQTATTVSPVNEITQRDFEYRSPQPEARVVGQVLPQDQRLRRVTVTLKRLWDSLPVEAQEQWPAEDPENELGRTADRRKPASIPDLDVIYQIVHIFRGNVEVQAELFANPALVQAPNRFGITSSNPAFQFRQLGRSFRVNALPGINVAPAVRIKAPPASEVSGDYKIETSLLQVTRVQLRQNYVLSQIPPETRSKVEIENGSLLSILGVLRPDDVIRILLPQFLSAVTLPPEANSPGLPRPAQNIDEASGFAAWKSFYQEFYATRLVPAFFDLGSLAGKLDFPLATSQDEVPAILRDRLQLSFDFATWTGVITAGQLEELGRFGSSLPQHRYHGRIINAVRQAHQNHEQEFKESYLATTRPLEREPVPGLIIEQVAAAAADGPGSSRWDLKWNGVMSSATADALRALPGDKSFRDAIRALIPDPLPPASFARTQRCDFRQPVRRVQRQDLNALFSEAELAPIVIPTDEGDSSGDPDLIFRWRQHAPLPLPASVYKARVEQRFDADPFVAAFSSLIDQAVATINVLGITTSNINFPPVLLRCRGRLGREEAERLRQSLNPNTGIDDLIKDIEDRAALEDIANDWFATQPISAVPAALPASIPSVVIDFPPPTQCTVVWNGALNRPVLSALTGDPAFLEARDEILRARPVEPLPAGIAGQLTIDVDKLRWTGAAPTDSQKAALRALSGDDQFAAAVKSLISAIPDNSAATQVITVPLSSVIISVAPVGFDQPPTSLQGKVEAVVTGANFTAVRWTSQTPMLDSDLQAWREWPPMAPFTAALDGIARKEVTLALEVPSATVRPRPTPSDLPAALRDKLTIEPEKLTWSGRLRDLTHLVMLTELVGDDAFNAAIATILEFLKEAPSIAIGPVPVRPKSSAQLLVGRAVIRYHGLMTPEEARSLQSAFAAQSDKDAIARLFDSSAQRGLQGSALMVRARRGSAAPSEMVPLEAERLA